MEIKVNSIAVPSTVRTLNAQMFSKKFNEPLIHQAVNAHLCNLRAGNSAQKTRSEVRGGGKKPWKQKGTGQARAGTIRSPLWRKGGVIFAAKPRSYKQKLNKKMFSGAMYSIWSELYRQDRLFLVDQFMVANPKTKDLLKLLKSFEITSNVLIIVNKFEKNLELAARNLYNVEISEVLHVNPYMLIKYEKILITSDALNILEENYDKNN